MTLISDIQKISTWIELILEKQVPLNIEAYNFNIYEETDSAYGIQLIGTDSFDLEDEDWACTDYYTSDENLCYIDRTPDIEDWQLGLSYIKNLIEEYLLTGGKKEILLNSRAVGVGFVDGAIEFAYIREE